MKQWQCIVCGYIHTGDEPPEKCPVCGADKTKFVEITEKKAAASKKPRKKPLSASPVYNRVTDLMIRHHAHPISAHIPNGVAPVAVVFVFLSAIFQFANLSTAAFYNMVFVLLSLPVVMFAGFNEWRKKYQSSKTPLFVTKIIAAFVVVIATLIIVVWYMINPNITQAASAGRPVFLLTHVILLAAAGIAGFIGGKPVFKD